MNSARPTETQVKRALRRNARVPLLGGPRDGEDTVLDCEQFVCDPPFRLTPDHRVHTYTLRSLNGRLVYVHASIDRASET